MLKFRRYDLLSYDFAVLPPMNPFVIKLPFRKEQFDCSFQNCLFVVSNLLIKLFDCNKHASLLFVVKFLPYLGGNDAASARYIFTKISPLTRCQFHQRFTARIFRTKVFSAAFLCLESGFEQTFVWKIRA